MRSRRRNPDAYIPTFLRFASRTTRIRYSIDAFWNGTPTARRNLYARLQRRNRA